MFFPTDFGKKLDLYVVQEMQDKVQNSIIIAVSCLHAIILYVFCIFIYIGYICATMRIYLDV